MVTVQVLRGTSADGDQLAEQVKSGWTGVCAGSTVERRDAGTVNGYPWVLWHFGCPMNPQTGKPEAMWLKAVRGADALYVVQQAHRALPSDELEARAVEYLGSVSVCDTRGPEHPCPAGM
jgi:hypothetical protein